MQRSNEETLTLWNDKQTFPFRLTQLQKNLETDICVVGAGIAGLTTAYLLQKQGRRVVVIDAWDLAAGETSRTTAHITAVLDDRFFNLESRFGENNAKLAAQSHKAAIDQIEEIVNNENIECDFERLDGYLVSFTDEELKDLKQEQKAVERVGFVDMKILSCVPIPGIINTGETMQFPQQAAFNIGKYINGLAAAFQRIGGEIYIHSPAVKIKDGDEVFVLTKQQVTIKAKSVVVATNSPINDKFAMHTKQAAYRTYVTAFEIPKEAYPSFLLWDLADPYHYVRTVRGETCDFLLVGGEDHKTGQATKVAEQYNKLKEWAQQHFSILGPVKYQWSGQVMEPVDYLAFIGRNPGDKNVYVCTGDSGHGMTHGTIAGILISDLVCGRSNAWEKLYDPSRITLSAGMEFAKENLNVISCIVKDWLKPEEVKDIGLINSGEGAIFNNGIYKFAVYKDEKGKIYKCSAVCTHLGCIVHWNKGEKSWDCPCHGSRFDYRGQILNGPAIKPLALFRTQEE